MTNFTQGVLKTMILESNDNVVALYDDAICRLLNDDECNVESLVSEGFERDAIETLYAIEMDNE
jgi:hypothetical protein